MSPRKVVQEIIKVKRAKVPLVSKHRQHVQDETKPSRKPVLLTATHRTLRLNLQTTLVDQVKCLHRVPSVDDARDVNLRCALADHLDVDVAVRQRREHPPGDTYEVAHLLADE